MLSELDRVTDDAGVEFVLGQKIAEGAQGAVFRVEGHPGYAIKLLDRPEDLSAARGVSCMESRTRLPANREAARRSAK